MKNFVIVPTYNESKNIERLLRGIAALGMPDLGVVVIDDGSPDGTARLVEKLIGELPGIHLLERVGERGRGTADIAGLDFALKMGAQKIVQMDADFSHPPSDIPRLLAAVDSADIAIASRLVEGSVDLRPKRRHWITRFANAYARWFLGSEKHRVRILDWSSGFRAYRREVFSRVLLSKLISVGPNLLQEILYKAMNYGYTATEIPFRMEDRKHGVSNFSGHWARQCLLSIPCYRVLFGSIRADFELSKFTTSRAGERHFRMERVESQPGLA